MGDQNYKALLLLPLGLLALWCRDFYSSLAGIDRTLFWILAAAILSFTAMLVANFATPWGKDRRRRLEKIRELPSFLLKPGADSVCMGIDDNLQARIFLPDEIRTRHVHIIGATGSGKTESVILNFIKQDINRGLGSIILDAKGDHSFAEELLKSNSRDQLFIFDLGSADSIGYDPLENGTPLESAQRLFSSLTWSEEYYRSKALSSLQRIFQTHFEMNGRNPLLVEINDYLETPKKYSALVCCEDFPQSLALAEFQDLSGLRDQIKSLTIGHLAHILSPKKMEKIDLEGAMNGAILYFRLQSLMSPQLVSILGRLIVNHLNFLAGSAHRARSDKHKKLVPIYFDEFASFACLEFADLISKARSAGFALHFSHQSIGDVTEVSPGFLNRITDNAATKIILRINDPDSAEFFARSFGTKQIQKTTQRITNTKNIESAEVVGEGTTRDAHQFRSSPDLFKTLPTGVGAVLVAHGQETPHGASSVFTIRFPKLQTDVPDV